MTPPLGPSNSATQREPGQVLTPIGLVSESAVRRLQAFGKEADRRQLPRIDVGGLIVPGLSLSENSGSGYQRGQDVTAGREGQFPWRESSRRANAQGHEGSQPSTPLPSETPHAIRHGLTQANLDVAGLVKYFPASHVTAQREGLVYLSMQVQLFEELPLGARLLLEVPLAERTRLSRPSVLPTPVPDVRAWAVWEGGPSHGRVVRSHHQNPEGAICACMPHEWLLGVHPLRDYAAFCVLWTAKLLHEQWFGRYPGQQHYHAFARVQRDRQDEYCGCGGMNSYAACCRESDRREATLTHWRNAKLASAQYLRELAAQRRPILSPEDVAELAA